MAYGRGFAAVVEAVEKSKQGGSFGKFAHPLDSLWDLSWDKKAGEKQKRVRFLTDNFLTVKIHQFITTKDGKKANFACTAELEGELQRPCFICNNITREVSDDKGNKKVIPAKPTTRILAVVVEREVDGQGNVFDKTREMDLLVDPNNPDGPTEKLEVPKFAIFGMSATTADLMNGYYVKYKKTTLDRDYDINRSGEGLKTTYQPIPNDPDEYKTAEALWDLYDIKHDKGEDPVLNAMIQWLERRGTEEYYNRRLNTGVEPKNNVPDDVDDDESNDSDSSAPSNTAFAGLKAGLLKKYPERLGGNK